MENTSSPSGIKFVLRSFHYRNYRLFFSGQGISLIGTWIQNIAVSWLVYRLTNSEFLLGVVGFAGQIPAFVLTPFAGVLADRWNRRQILVATQTLAMLQALALAFLVLSGNVTIWHLIPLSVFLGLVNAFDTPARQSFVVDIIEKKEDLGNAIALNSSMFNGARLVGPSIAGMLIAGVGEGICFLLNGISYIAVILALLAMRIKPRQAKPGKTLVLNEFREGLAYTWGFSPIKYILSLLALVSLVGMPYSVLMPVFAREILKGGPHTLGFLMGASGTGALAGAYFLASRRNTRGLETFIPAAAGIFGAGLAAFSRSGSLGLSMSLLVLTGFCMMVNMASCNTVLQTIVDDDKRGRVMSLYTTAFMGMMPFGSLLGGGLAARIGAADTVLLGGISCIAGALVFAAKLPALRKAVAARQTGTDCGPPDARSI
ncbi:MAG TPA: MFS transporter [Bacillota bacterium]|nr:MFS transporter [Bacillota bacterium]